MSAYETLNNFNLYFRALSEAGKERFLNRLNYLSENINIRGIDLQVTNQMKDIILSYFVQLTFGYKNYIIGNYTTVQLYEHSFVQQSTGTEKEGLTFGEKIIALSWLPFSKSHLLVNDGENLGFYHIAQALVQAMNSGKSADDKFISYFETCGNIVCDEVKSKPKHPFYIAHQYEVKERNFKQLFPYFIEWFFEKPNELYLQLPDAYAHICLLLNQDPLSFDNDYKFDLNKYQGKKGVSPLPIKIKKLFGAYQNHWIYNLPLISVLIMPVFYIYYIRPNIILSNASLGLLLLSISTGYFLLGYRFFIGRKLFKTKFWYFVNSFFGAGPLLFCFILSSAFILNFNVKETQHPIAYNYKIFGERKARRSNYKTTYLKEVIISFKDDFLEEFQDNRVFFTENHPNLMLKEGTMVYYKTATSIWGFDVVLAKGFLDSQVINLGE